MRKLLAALLLSMLTSSAGFPQASQRGVVATAIPLDPRDPAHRTVGGLRYVAGWHLTSRHDNFGGFSSLRVQGDQILALSDSGDWLRFRLSPSGETSDVAFGLLPAFPTNTGSKSDRDSESMTTGPDGDIWVGFEARNAILRYTRDFGALVAKAQPPAMRNWSFNSGAEAMARLSDGRFAVFCEGTAVAPLTHAALLFPGDPTDLANEPVQFGYRPPQGYVPTDAQQLPDGRIIVLHRHFAMLDGFWAALAIVDPREIKPGAIVDGKLVAELKPPLNIDNMEGISVTQEGGRTMIWIISDDNQVPLERTLLLKFELDEGAGK